MSTTKEERFICDRLARDAVCAAVIWFGPLEEENRCPVCLCTVKPDGTGHLVGCPYPYFMAWDKMRAAEVAEE